MAETEAPLPPPRPTSNGTSAAQQPSAVRYRLPHRSFNRQDTSSSQSPKPDLSRRRSSLLSFSSLDDARQSFADDIIAGGSRRRGSTAVPEEEVSHWHSTPLAFAILPALGGLLFKNGSALITDLLLLGLAAVFLNWSVRLPWDWYYSAQAIRLKDERGVCQDTIPKELDQDNAPEHALESESSIEGSPTALPGSEHNTQPRTTTRISLEQNAASADLRAVERWALVSTFIFPALAAYLLHVIRAQLSRPSNSVVTDYNLSIFLLAAEIRPCRQLVRLVTERTLHLQRVATGRGDPMAAKQEQGRLISDLTSRLADLETRLSEHQIIPQTVSIAQKHDVSDLSSQMQKRYEPRLEGLERAVRRYEKRTTTLAMLTEQRLSILDGRLQDTLSLAAVAAQSSQKSSVVAVCLSWISSAFAFPLKIAWSICIWPWLILEDIYSKMKMILLGPGAVRKRKGGTKSSSGRDEKSREKRASMKGLRS